MGRRRYLGIAIVEVRGQEAVGEVTLDEAGRRQLLQQGQRERRSEDTAAPVRAWSQVGVLGQSGPALQLTAPLLRSHHTPGWTLAADTSKAPALSRGTSPREV